MARLARVQKGSGYARLAAALGPTVSYVALRSSRQEACLGRGEIEAEFRARKLTCEAIVSTAFPVHSGITRTRNVAARDSTLTKIALVADVAGVADQNSGSGSFRA